MFTEMSKHDDNIGHETSGPSSAQETPTPTSTPTPASLSSPSPAESAKVVEKQISLLDQSHNQSENPKKRKLTLTVWNDFIKKIVNGDEIAVCTHCELARLLDDFGAPDEDVDDDLEIVDD
ncbi:hypothetical protein Cni_G22216 [Canna indica]|uniref:Uncharacterized protein n=1 Tax=Canna indica TaxID=4628 RepID=A0AAQ3QI18_9LILI|nr:hypothetical protein Cni_G22216 [Canna indica]